MTINAATQLPVSPSIDSADCKVAPSLSAIDTGLLRMRPALFTLLMWTAVGLLQAVPEMLRDYQWPPLVGRLTGAWVWALFTPAILLLDRRLTSAHQNFIHLSIAHLALSVPISILHTYLLAAVQYPIAGIAWSPFRNPDYVVFYFVGGWTNYCAFVGILQGFKFYNRFLVDNV